jgi:hypothetical protein
MNSKLTHYLSVQHNIHYQKLTHALDPGGP